MHRDGFFCVPGLRFALPCGVAASLWPAVAAAASPASTTLRRQRAEAGVESGVSLIDPIQRSFVESFIWQLARMKSKSCPCSPSRRLSCDRVTHRRALTKFVELSPRVAVITLRCSLLWQSMMFQCTKAGREQQLGPSVDTRTCVSLRRLGDLSPFFRPEGVLACRTSLGARRRINAHASVYGV